VLQGDEEVEPLNNGSMDGYAGDEEAAAVQARTPTTPMGALAASAAERVPTGITKTCSLCGNTRDTSEFGPKKGSRDGKDCYCRICSTLRRRYSIPVLSCPPMQHMHARHARMHARGSPPRMHARHTCTCAHRRPLRRWCVRPWRTAH
jgi:hypothetical protein